MESASHSAYSNEQKALHPTLDYLKGRGAICTPGSHHPSLHRATDTRCEDDLDLNVNGPEKYLQAIEKAKRDEKALVKKD